MTLVVFLRGVNAGGHRRFRPRELARALRAYQVVSIGAAGTFVVRRPGSRARLLAALRRSLPFTAEIALCEARELLRLRAGHPFGTGRARPGVVRFVGILTRPPRAHPTLPAALPPRGEWLVRVLGARRRLLVGLYRRQMKTIGYLGQLDRLFGAPVTTRSWSTLEQVARVLQERRGGL